MIRYRPFLNTDPPLLADIWRRQPPLRGLAQGISAKKLEEFVLGKTYFDRHGLIVAEEDGRAIGFAHAGFGPQDNLNAIDYSVGVVSRILVVPHQRHGEIATELLKHAESYLRERGAERFHGFGYHPNTPFYLGMYGGSRLPGVLEDDRHAIELFSQNGYRDIGRQLIYQCRLPGFRPLVDRHQMMVRRQYQIMAVIDPIPETWWEACTLGNADRTRFKLMHRASGEQHGDVIFWDIEPLSSSWGVHAMGLYDLHVHPGHRRKGLATFLVGESLRQLQSQGVTVAEVQMREDDEATRDLFEKLGFDRIDQARLLVKE